MTLREYLDKLHKLIKDYPEYLDLPVVYSTDDSGNSFRYVYHNPSVGSYDVEDRDFSSVWDQEEWQLDQGVDESEINIVIDSICLN